MASVRPPTRSPGFVVLPYSVNGDEHRMGVRLVFGMDPYNGSQMQAIADSLAQNARHVVTSAVSFTRFEVYDPTRSFIGGGGLNSTYVGDHSGVTGMVAWRSLTATVTGKGNAAAAGYAVGQTRLLIRIGNAYGITPGTKRLTPDAAMLNLMAHLRNSPYIWADFFGQKATPNALPTVQFNAHIQRVEGS